jgi:hypothetical protein
MKGVLRVLGEILALLARTAALLWAWKSGRDELRAKQAEAALERRDRAEAARRRLESDPAYADGLRRRFTRRGE